MSARSTCGVLYAFAILWCGVWWWLAPDDHRGHYFREGGMADLLSSIALLAAALLAWGSSLVGRGSSLQGFWRLAALGLVFFAADDRLQLHEHAHDYWLFDAFGAAPFGLRNWNDLIVLLYGLGALLALALWGRGTLRVRPVRNLLAVAFAFYALHSLTDMLLPGSHLKNAAEESCKLLGATSLLLAFHAALLHERDAARERVASGPGPLALLAFFALVAALAWALLGGGPRWQDLLQDFWGSPHSWLVTSLLGSAALLFLLVAAGRQRPIAGGLPWLVLALALVATTLGEGMRATRETFRHPRVSGRFPDTLRHDLAWMHDPVGMDGIAFATAVLVVAWMGRRAWRASPPVGAWLATGTGLLLLSLPVNEFLEVLGDDLLAPLLRIAGAAALALAAVRVTVMPEAHPGAARRGA